MKEYIKMGFGLSIGMVLGWALLGTVSGRLSKKIDTDKTESNNDKVDESAE